MGKLNVSRQATPLTNLYVGVSLLKGIGTLKKWWWTNPNGIHSAHFRNILRLLTRVQFLDLTFDYQQGVAYHNSSPIPQHLQDDSLLNITNMIWWVGLYDKLDRNSQDHRPSHSPIIIEFSCCWHSKWRCLIMWAWLYGTPPVCPSCYLSQLPFLVIWRCMYIYIYIYLWLVVSSPLKNMKVSWDYYSPYM